MEKLTRRAFARQMGSSLFSFMLVQTLCREDLLAGPVKSAVHSWLHDIERISHGLAAGTLKPVEWQQQIETVLGQVDLAELLRAIDYDRLAKKAILPEDHEFVEGIHLSASARLPGELSFSPYFYGLKKGRAIVPHGHHNMATMHMILHGEAHGRHFERVADEPTHMTIRPTTDAVCRPGQVSTISDQKDNVHWFVALTEPVFMFNIGVYGIKAGEASSGRDYIDPASGELLSDGSIRARKLNSEEAYRKYGKTSG